MMRPTFALRFALAAAVLTVPLASVELTAAGASTTNVNIVGYSVVGPAFTALEAAFQSTPAGQNVNFTNSFGASDTQSTNVANGQPADIVNLSYTPNVTSLVTAGKVPTNWTTQEAKIAKVNPALQGTKAQTTFSTPGIVTDSTVVFIVRSGNPFKIANWSNLTRNGMQIVTPNPLTSGSAKWNLLAAYSSQISLKKSPSAAQDFLKDLLQHTISQPVSGSAAMAAFLAGTGNVLLDYEDNALAAIAAGKPIQIVTPPQTLLIENPLALTKTGLSNSGAVAFYKYLYSAAGQGIFASLGYRSVLKTVWTSTRNNFPAFKRKTNLLSVGNLAKTGWSAVNPEFFGSTVKFATKDKRHPTAGIVTYLEQFAGQSV